MNVDVLERHIHRHTKCCKIIQAVVLKYKCNDKEKESRQVLQLSLLCIVLTSLFLLTTEKRQAVSDDSSSLRSEETSSSLSANVEKLVVNEDMRNLALEEEDYPDNLASGFSLAVEKLNDKRWSSLTAQILETGSELCTSLGPG